MFGEFVCKKFTSKHPSHPFTPPTPQGLAGDKVWAALPAQDKINMQEKGICPPNRESECFFDWLHWKSQLVLDKHELTAALAPLIAGVVDRAAGAAL